MITKLFLDTCLLIDYFGARQPYFEDMLKVRVAQLSGDVELWCSAKSFTDVFCVLARRVGSQELQRAFGESLEFLHVASVGGRAVGEAARLAWDDFEDCLVYEAARRCGADVLLTRDGQGFCRAPMAVMSPGQWLERQRAELGVWYVTPEGF